MGDNKYLSIIALFTLLLMISVVSAVKPTGGSLSVIGSQTTTPDTPDSLQAIAGNVTEMNVVGYSVTQSWQGYYGNISGTIQLADSSDNILYNWTLASPEGEIYASTSNGINWGTIMCFNFTATNSLSTEDDGNAGNTSLRGHNLAYMENAYNIDSNDVDGLDETFSLTDGSGYKHSAFYTNSLKFSAGECLSVHLRGENGAINDSNYEEVLLYDSTSEELVFASLIDKENLNGFDGEDRDFEMLVLEDGHGTDTSTTTYYFYVELE